MLFLVCGSVIFFRLTKFVSCAHTCIKKYKHIKHKRINNFLNTNVLSFSNISKSKATYNVKRDAKFTTQVRKRSPYPLVIFYSSLFYAISFGWKLRISKLWFSSWKLMFFLAKIRRNYTKCSNYTFAFFLTGYQSDKYFINEDKFKHFFQINCTSRLEYFQV